MSARGSATAKRAAERTVEIRRVIAILQKWGVHTLGEFAALAKEDVALRLGPEAVRMWMRASGKTTRLLKLIEPPETFAETFEFEQEIETSEPLLFILRRFLQALTLRLGALYLVAKELHLEIRFSDQQKYAHNFKIPEPGNNVEVLFRMLHAHLENFKSEAPIVAVSLAAIAARPAHAQGNLFETALRDSTQLAETLARLMGLLGGERMGTPVLEDTHQPDAFRMEPFTWRIEETAPGLPPLPLFALRRFRSAPPLPKIEVEKATNRIGPFLASGNWWDEKAWSRAEWDLQFANGTLCRCHQHAHGWSMDGIYD
ncbi:MAG: hypothetical protein ABI992_00565 [Chthoniobacterales bacterium]